MGVKLCKAPDLANDVTNRHNVVISFRENKREDSVLKGFTMRLVLLLAMAAVTSYASDAQVPRVKGEAFITTMHVRGKEIRFTINDTDLEGSPAWFHPESDPPPFAIGEAIRVAKGELGRYVDDPEQWRPCSIDLRTFERRAAWFYVVEWRPRSKGYIGDGVSIPVLMNGTAVHGEIRRDTRLHTGWEHGQ